MKYGGIVKLCYLLKILLVDKIKIWYFLELLIVYD